MTKTLDKLFKVCYSYIGVNEMKEKQNRLERKLREMKVSFQRYGNSYYIHIHHVSMLEANIIYNWAIKNGFSWSQDGKKKVTGRVGRSGHSVRITEVTHYVIQAG